MPERKAIKEWKEEGLDHETKGRVYDPNKEDDSDGPWWLSRCDGYTKKRSEAHIYTFGEIDNVLAPNEFEVCDDEEESDVQDSSSSNTILPSGERKTVEKWQEEGLPLETLGVMRTSTSDNSDYWKDLGKGATSDINQAHVYTFQFLVDKVGAHGVEYQIFEPLVGEIIVPGIRKPVDNWELEELPPETMGYIYNSEAGRHYWRWGEDGKVAVDNTNHLSEAAEFPFQEAIDRCLIGVYEFELIGRKAGGLPPIPEKCPRCWGALTVDSERNWRCTECGKTNIR